MPRRWPSTSWEFSSPWRGDFPTPSAIRWRATGPSRLSGTRRFARDPSVLGKTFRIGNDRFEIVGVGPRGFIGTEPGELTDIFVPAMMNAQAINRPVWSWFRIWMRPKPGWAADQTRQPLQAAFLHEREECVKSFDADTPRQVIDLYMSQKLLLMPAATGASDLQKLGDHLDGVERAYPREQPVVLVPMLEDPGAVLDARAIAAASRRGFALVSGSEDLATALGGEPTPEVLRLPKLLVHLAAKAAGVRSFGLLRTVADYNDLEGIEKSAHEARRFGFDGASCVHPAVVPILNRAFSPSPEELDRARALIAAFEAAKADGRGAFAFRRPHGGRAGGAARPRPAGQGVRTKDGRAPV